MSKKRPSRESALALVSQVANALSKADSKYWYRRLFKNTFTYKGNLVETRRWCVKIQFQGKRKTFSLSSEDRSRAAAEALAIYSDLVAGGWAFAKGADRGAVEPNGERRIAGNAGDPEAKSHASFWKPRLVVRKYTETLGPRLRRELSVRIEHDGAGHYFPLGTEDPDRGALRAAEIHRTVLLKGWDEAKRRYAREFTIGILWANNPFACTYATLYSEPDHKDDLSAAAHLHASRRILIVDPDPGIRRALGFWIDQRFGLGAAETIADSRMARRAALQATAPACVLVNQDSIEGRELLDHLREARPKMIAFFYGVFENSDDIFASVTGVSRGYMLRRRPPGLLLEPIARVLGSPAPSADEAARQIKIHFQNLFEPSLEKEEWQSPVSLTRREQEILNSLSKGYLDKEIATKLGISAWTVHSHLKRIYEKLSVHTRTEAVVKYLQK